MDSTNSMLLDGVKRYEGKKARVTTIYATSFIGTVHFINDVWVEVKKDEKNTTLLNLNHVVSLSEQG